MSPFAFTRYLVPLCATRASQIGAEANRFAPTRTYASQRAHNAFVRRPFVTRIRTKRGAYTHTMPRAQNFGADMYKKPLEMAENPIFATFMPFPQITPKHGVARHDPPFCPYRTSPIKALVRNMGVTYPLYSLPYPCPTAAYTPSERPRSQCPFHPKTGVNRPLLTPKPRQNAHFSIVQLFA